MWKVGCTKIESTRARYIFLVCVHGNSRKSDFLGKTLHTRKFSMVKFLGAATQRNLTHSGIRKYSRQWVTEPLFRSYSSSKKGHRPKTGSVTKNQSRDGSKSLRQFWSNRFESNRIWSSNIRAHVLFVWKRSDQN